MPQSGSDNHAAGPQSPNDAFFLVTPDLVYAASAATPSHYSCRTSHPPCPHVPTPPPDNARATGVATHAPSSPATCFPFPHLKWTGRPRLGWRRMVRQRENRDIRGGGQKRGSELRGKEEGSGKWWGDKGGQVATARDPRNPLLPRPSRKPANPERYRAPTRRSRTASQKKFPT